MFHLHCSNLASRESFRALIFYFGFFCPHGRDLPLRYARLLKSHAEVVLPLSYVSSLTRIFKLLPSKLLVESESGGRFFWCSLTLL